jgi:hypothetical protein
MSYSDGNHYFSGNIILLKNMSATDRYLTKRVQDIAKHNARVAMNRQGIYLVQARTKYSKKSADT